MNRYTGILASGQLPTSAGDLLALDATLPFTANATINSVSFHNTNAATQTVILYAYSPSDTSRIVGRYTLAQNETVYVPGNFSLGAGHALKGVTTTGSAVDYVLFGSGYY